jgi:hypothetical protein
MLGLTVALFQATILISEQVVHLKVFGVLHLKVFGVLVDSGLYSALGRGCSGGRVHNRCGLTRFSGV